MGENGPKRPVSTAKCPRKADNTIRSVSSALIVIAIIGDTAKTKVRE